MPDRYFSWFMTVFLAAVAQEFTIAKQITGLGRGARRSRTPRGCAVSSAVPFQPKRCPWRWKTAPRQPTHRALFRPLRRAVSRPWCCRRSPTALFVRWGSRRRCNLSWRASASVALLRYGPLLDQAAERTFAFMPFTPTWNATGQPAASLPLHRTPDGLPMACRRPNVLGRRQPCYRLPPNWNNSNIGQTRLSR